MTRFPLRSLLACLALMAGVAAPSAPLAQSADERQYAVQPAVDGLSFSGSVLAGTTGTYSNAMGIGTLNFPLNSLVSGQLDIGVGRYRSDYYSTAIAGRMYWRYWEGAALGLYAEYSNLNPEHSGRAGIEGSYHLGQVTLEGLVGVRNGTNIYTSWFNEIDATYYVTENAKASIGHRYTARGHVANVGFELAPEALGGWTIFGEAEAGEDDNSSAFAGVRFTLGQDKYQSLIDRDRNGPLRVRAPRGLVDITRCGELPEKQDGVSYGGRHSRSVLCASKDELDDENAVEGKKSKDARD